MDSGSKTTEAGSRYQIADGICLHVDRGTGLGEAIGDAWGLEQASPGGQTVCSLVASARGSPEQVLYPCPGGSLTAEGVWLGGTLAVDFRTLGPGCALACSPQASPRDILPWLNLLLPPAGVIPLHASAFAWQGQVCVLAGPAGSGKTGVLLAAVSKGAEAVGDECVWLGPGGRLRGIPVDMEVRLAYLRAWPAFRGRVPRPDRRRAQIYGALARVMPSDALARKAASRARATVHAETLLGPYLKGVAVNRLVLSVTRDAPGIAVRRITTSEAVERLVHLQMQEYAPQRRCYAHALYLFPGLRNDFMDHLDAGVSKALAEALKGVETCVLEHPQPVSPADLVTAMQANGRRR